MADELSLEQLAGAVQAWCQKHHVRPANGQAAEEITERTIRYYRTLGLLDAPVGNYVKRFSEKHKLQLIAIRLYQAHGLPLRKIRDELYGKSLAELSVLEKQARNSGQRAFAMTLPSFVPEAGSECWGVTPLAEEFLLVSRRNRTLPRSVVEQLNAVLRSAGSEQSVGENTNNGNPERTIPL